MRLLFAFILSLGNLHVLAQGHEVPDSVYQSAKSGDISAIDRLITHYLMVEFDAEKQMFWAKRGADSGSVMGMQILVSEYAGRRSKADEYSYWYERLSKIPGLENQGAKQEALPLDEALRVSLKTFYQKDMEYQWIVRGLSISVLVKRAKGVSVKDTIYLDDDGYIAMIVREGMPAGKLAGRLHFTNAGNRMRGEFFKANGAGIKFEEWNRLPR